MEKSFINMLKESMNSNKENERTQDDTKNAKQRDNTTKGTPIITPTDTTEGGAGRDSTINILKQRERANANSHRKFYPASYYERCYKICGGISRQSRAESERSQDREATSRGVGEARESINTRGNSFQEINTAQDRLSQAEQQELKSLRNKSQQLRNMRYYTTEMREWELNSLFKLYDMATNNNDISTYKIINKKYNELIQNPNLKDFLQYNKELQTKLDLSNAKIKELEKEQEAQTKTQTKTQDKGFSR